MKKMITVILSGIVLLTTSAFADIGVNIGISGSAGLVTATGEEAEKNTAGTFTETTKDTEHGDIGYVSVFIEKTLGDRLAIGLDYVPSSLSTATTESTRGDTDSASVVTSKENKIQIDFEDLATLYVAFNVTENFYVKAGMAQVDIITNENLATGSSYGNTDMDGTVFGIGYNHSMDSGVFF